MIKYTELVDRRFGIPRSVLCLDPGETTGWAFFDEGRFGASGQIAQRDFALAVDKLAKLVQWIKPTHVVIEDYKVYSHKAAAHTWSALHTPRLIGAIQTLCVLADIPYFMQMASAKRFCTDEKLKVWHLYQRGDPHANDAIRHGIYFLLFGKE